MTDEKRWLPVKGYEDYFLISDHGDVWSVRTNKLIKQSVSRSGYKVVSSRIGGREGRAICKKVHRWVAEVFIENPENKPYVNHINCIKTDNRSENLEWCTRKENVTHAKENGLYKSMNGEESPVVVLSESFIDEVRKRYVPYCRENGLRAISRDTGISHTTLSKALLGRTWGHLTK